MSDKILLLGSSNDPTMQYVLAHLKDGVEHIDFLDVNWFVGADRISFDEDAENGPEIKIDGNVFYLNEYRSFFQRFWPTDEICKSEKWNAIDVINAINQWLRLSDRLVVNSPRAGYSNSSKVLHSVLLAEFGFEIPDFFVTANADVCQAELRDPRGWITKGVSSTRTRAAVYEVAHELRFKGLRLAPVLFQRLVTGNEYRLHVVGTRSFGLKISCDRVDYRYAAAEGADVQFESADLPQALVSKCIDYCRSNALIIAGFDFIHSKDDEIWYLLEVNPAPGFDFFDRRIDNKIVGALGEILNSGRAYPDHLPDILDDEKRCDDVFIAPYRRPMIRY